MVFVNRFAYFSVGIVFRQKPNVLDRAVGFQHVAQRAAYWRWAGLLALNFNRRTEVEFCTSVDTKPFSPPIANTMLAVRLFVFVFCFVNFIPIVFNSVQVKSFNKCKSDRKSVV